MQFLNQSVLLANVNDDADILAATFAKCHAMGVRPYYLFHGRPVKAASHFQVPLRRGVEIACGVNQRLSGIQKTFKYIMSHYTAAKAAGLDFAQLVNRIVDVAYARYFAEPLPIAPPSATNYPVVA